VYKLLIADKSEDFCHALEEQMHCLDEVHTCKYGMRALEMVKKIEPDVFVLELSLSGLDGIGVLHAIKNAGYHPMVLAATYQVTDYILYALENLSVNYIVEKPCTVLNVAARLYEFATLLSNADCRSWNLRDEAYTILLSLGISLCGKNFACIHEALVYATEHQNSFVTKELYPAVGKTVDCNWKQVERDIRTSIESAWATRDVAIWQEYFPNRVGQKGKPTNSVFISTLGQHLNKRISNHLSKR